MAFTGTPASPAWLDPGAVEALLAARPDRNVPPDIARNIMRGVLATLPGAIAPHLEQFAHELAASLREAHVRVRTAARGERAGDLGVRGLTVGRSCRWTCSASTSTSLEVVDDRPGSAGGAGRRRS